MDVHIPKITIKSNFKPPWLDADCYEKCRGKERLIKKFKRTKALNDEIKFATCRREFKSMIRRKLEKTSIAQMIIMLSLRNFGHMSKTHQSATESLKS